MMIATWLNQSFLWLLWLGGFPDPTTVTFMQVANPFLLVGYFFSGLLWIECLLLLLAGLLWLLRQGLDLILTHGFGLPYPQHQSPAHPAS